MRHSPFGFIHFRSGLFGGGGRAFLPVSGLVQYRSKIPSPVHRACDRERDACRTALAAMLWYSESDSCTGCGSGRVGSGLLSETLAGTFDAFLSTGTLGTGDGAADHSC